MEAHDFGNFLNRIICFTCLAISMVLLVKCSKLKVCSKDGMEHRTASTTRLCGWSACPEYMLCISTSIMATEIYKLKTSLRYSNKLNIYIASSVSLWCWCWCWYIYPLRTLEFNDVLMLKTFAPTNLKGK